MYPCTWYTCYVTCPTKLLYNLKCTVGEMYTKADSVRNLNQIFETRARGQSLSTCFSLLSADPRRCISLRRRRRPAARAVARPAAGRDSESAAGSHPPPPPRRPAGPRARAGGPELSWPGPGYTIVKLQVGLAGGGDGSPGRWPGRRCWQWVQVGWWSCQAVPA